MRATGEKSGLERIFPDNTSKITKNGREIIPYCNMREKTCFDFSYANKCPNFETYIIEDEN